MAAEPCVIDQPSQPGAEMAENWYYAEGERSLGPVGLDELRSILGRRREASRVLVWNDGLSGWTEAGAIPELAGAVAGLPPLPQQSASVAVPDQGVSPPPPDNGQAAHREKEPSSRLRKILGWSFAAISLVLSKVLGGVYWMPVLLIALSTWALTRLKLRDYTVWMFGVLIGHTLWMLAGFAMLFHVGKPSPAFATFLGDLVAVACLSVWGLRKQSPAAAIGVLIY
jgi:GYF domain 2